MQIDCFDEDRTPLLPLFKLADDSETQIATYVTRGEVLVARDDDVIIGYLQLIETDETSVFELKSMAVTEKRQREGVGRRLVEAAIDCCRARNGHRLVVSTATADIGNLRFYQRQRFRMYEIVRDVFTSTNGYSDGVVFDGIPLRDQVFLDRDLTN